MNYAERVERLRAQMRRERVPAMLVSYLPNVRYLTGFSGSNGLLLVTDDEAVFWTDSRYREQAAKEVAGAEVRIPATGNITAAASRRVARLKRVAVEADRVTLAAAGQLFDQRRSYVAARGWVERLRAVKDDNEVAAIRRSVQLASSVFDKAVRQIKPGRCETQIAGHLEFAMRAAGGEGVAFETIVASGWHAAHVHGRASAKTVSAGEFVILDYGVILGGYVSDMTRTIHVGEVSTRDREVYRAVLEAQLAGIDAVAPGVAASQVDAAARSVLEKARLGEAFSHSTGHGLGLEIHEWPRLARRSRQRLETGNVITIEPGAYFPGWGGVRIEDVVLVTSSGAEVLTPTPKELVVV
jgi:Xaa-Pro aminopeptidase